MGTEQPGTAILAAPEGPVYVVCQQAADDHVQVGDLESAVALGATVAGHQPQEHVRVLLDPAGHPSCRCRDDG